MTITVNGASRDVPEGWSVTDLLADLGLGAGWVVVERNGEAVARARLGDVVLADGDVIEIVRAVAGG
jgi:sulfur carrier protein